MNILYMHTEFVLNVLLYLIIFGCGGMKVLGEGGM